MATIGTAEKLKMAKEILATAFLEANNKSLEDGLQYGYQSYPSEEGEHKLWNFDVKVKEAGYGERVIQQFKFHRPDNIDAKNMEYNVIMNVMSQLVQGAMLSWYELAKFLATDKDIQKAIIDETKQNNISSY